MAATRGSGIGVVGRRMPAFSGALRPKALDELGAWGGKSLLRGKRVLDVGCGDGRLAIGVAAYARSIVGLDPDAEAIASAKKAARRAGATNARFAVGAAQELRFPDHSFDVVILSWTL